jgi:adenylate kinase family enzyme
MKRIVIIGTSGSGKSTLCKQLAEKLRTRRIELDALNWEPNWKEADPEVFRARTSEATSAESWVCDGNYSRTRDIVWGRADTVIWLDYSRCVVTRRIIWRTFKRSLMREELWSGNRESLRKAFSRDSVILWSMQTYSRRKRETPSLLLQPQNSHLQILRFDTPSKTAAWLQGL